MAVKKVGERIKEARTEAGFTQESLAKKIKTLSASDISKAERGEKELTREELIAIAKLTGVTQKSLLEAPKSSTAKKTTNKTSTTKKTTSTGTTMKVTATEKKLVELYRAADSDTKKEVMKTLKGDASDAEEVLSDLLGGILKSLK